MLDVVNMIQIKTHICKFIFNLFYLFYLPGGSINTSFFKTNKKIFFQKIENYGNYFMLQA